MALTISEEKQHNIFQNFVLQNIVSGQVFCVYVTWRKTDKNFVCG